ncbi:hypothetical protein BJ165DRAFT_1410942 [Panaeolus papilionaceus]|nr:hypothetical protein BJ165DRAFT_1410942 [Panaeolus papilionaceus]
MKASTKFQTSDLANDPSRPQWELPASSPTLRGTGREPPRSDVGKWVGWNRTNEGYETDELGWTNENTLKERFVKYVLPAITARMFYSPLVVYSPADTKLATPLHQVTIRNLRWTKRRRHSCVPQPRISLFISNLLDVAGLPKSGGEHILIWAPREMIPYELQERA